MMNNIEYNLIITQVPDDLSFIVLTLADMHSQDNYLMTCCLRNSQNQHA